MTTRHNDSPAAASADWLDSSELGRRLLDDAEALARTGSFVWRLADAEYRYTNGVALVLGLNSAQRHTADELLARVHPDDQRRVSRLVRFALRDNPVQPADFRWLNDKGEVVYLVGQLRVEGEGEQRCLYGSLLDISERRRIEEQMTQAQKLEAVGTLAGGVAHDFNNFLQVIGGHCDLLLGDKQLSQRSRMSIEEIGVAVSRCKDLTKKLLAFARKQHSIPSLNDVSEVVTSTVRMLRPLLGDDVTLHIQCSKVPCVVRIDPVNLQQVLVNLAVNARDAMPKGGDLQIIVDPVLVDDAKASLFGVSPGSYCRVAVSDSGMGMPDSVAARVFEPFFTTKPRGAGTGLGLSTVHGIVQEAAGAIKVSSELGKGSCFTILLPTTNSELMLPAQSTPPAATERATETILLVEDGDDVRKVTQLQLETAGYSVITAATGDEALRITAAYPNPIHLLLTDVMMPRMSGPELAEQLVQARPGLPVVFMSGYTERQVLRRTALTIDRVSLHKPFSLEELLGCVRAHITDKAQ
ncbi:MAG TPA: ATP-binding protein [Polyangiaceae bacterium]|jgi:signal transduction histidine kinase/CheY-like chemotaxis protein|nr:ATP-binding protein [Polyangiaceae bacterium]